MHKTRSGELMIFGESLLWSLFPIFTILTVSGLPPLYSASITTFVAALFFAAVISLQKNWKQLLYVQAWKYILGATLIIGILFYSLVFVGISKTSAGNAGIALLMEVFFSFLILYFWKKERATARNVMGAVIMAIGAILVFLPETSGAGVGDLILIIATIVPPIGNYFQQKARALVSSSVLLFVRSAISSLFLFILAFIFSGPPNFDSVALSLPYIIISGIFFLGLSKILWIEGIHRIPITKAASLATIQPLFTLIFAFFILGEKPMPMQLLGVLPLIIGANLILQKKKQLLY